MVSNDASETKMEMDNWTSADHGYNPAKIIENLATTPLKSALKRQSSSCVRGEPHSAKSVTFSSETAKQSSTGDDEDFEECKFTNDQLEVMKQAVTLMGDLPEDVVQLAIDAYNLLQENQFFFGNSGELCQKADSLAQNLLRQGDLRERVNYVKQQLEEESAAKKKDLAYTHDKTPCNNDNDNTGNNDNDDDDNRKNDSENGGAPKDVTSFGDSGCPAPLAGMSEDGQHSSSSTTTSSSSSSSSKTSDESSAFLPTPSPSNMPTTLVQTAAFLSLFHHPSPSSIVAPSLSSCSDSSSLSASPNFAEVAYASNGCPSSGMSGAAHDDRSGQPLASEGGKNETSLEPNVTEDAENVPMSAKYVTKNAENVTKSAAELATSAQSLTEMREGSATSSSMTSAAPRHDHKHTHRLQALATENRRLKERKFCRACRKVDLAESGITFLPCGHFITCETCSEMFDDCPACGKNIMGTVRTFLS